MTREATVERNTKETKIAIKLNLDGSGKAVWIQVWDFSITC